MKFPRMFLCFTWNMITPFESIGITKLFSQLSVMRVNDHLISKHRTSSLMLPECRWQSLRTSHLKLAYILHYIVTMIDILLKYLYFGQIYPWIRNDDSWEVCMASITSLMYSGGQKKPAPLVVIPYTYHRREINLVPFFIAKCPL